MKIHHCKLLLCIKYCIRVVCMCVVCVLLYVCYCNLLYAIWMGININVNNQVIKYTPMVLIYLDIIKGKKYCYCSKGYSECMIYFDTLQMYVMISRIEILTIFEQNNGDRTEIQ